jgi:CubicO group peptidase (beta-lactamase class C family)
LGTLLEERFARPLGADVHIGLPDAEHARVTHVIGPNHARRQPPPEPLPTVPPLYAVALLNPSIRPFKDVGTAAWRRAEIAAANGHATAKGLARLYAALACGGELGGVRVMSREAIDTARRERHVDGLDLVLGRPMRRANGFILNTEAQYGPNPDTFGHSGAGGSYGIADPARRLAIGYTMNQMQPGLDPDTRGKRLLDAVYACL